jgi:hypothetical protein
VRKKALLILAVCLVAIASASLLSRTVLDTQNQQKYEINVVRSFSSQDEKKALSQAESINYSDITSLERLHGSSDPQDYLRPGTYLSYTYADYIDIETGVKKIGQTSFTMQHHFYKKESVNSERTLAAKAEITAVAFNDDTHTKVPLPDELVVALEKCMQS